jgi:hypothetical protein
LVAWPKPSAWVKRRCLYIVWLSPMDWLAGTAGYSPCDFHICPRELWGVSLGGITAGPTGSLVGTSHRFYARCWHGLPFGETSAELEILNIFKYSNPSLLWSSLGGLELKCERHNSGGRDADLYKIRDDCSLRRIYPQSC